jgi:hypothetical protein
MRRNLGEAASGIIDNDSYLPFHTNRHNSYREEYEFSVQEAYKKNAPGRWLARIWRRDAVDKTLIILRKLMNLAKCAALKAARQAKIAADNLRAKTETNSHGLAKLEQL